MKFTLRHIVLLLFCSSCFPTRPGSKYPGAISTNTALPYGDFISNGFEFERYDGFVDQFVLKFKGVRKYQQQKAVSSISGYTDKKMLLPNVVYIEDNIFMDEVETTNLHWREFLYYIKRDSSMEFYQKMLPIKEALPTDDYFDDDFYRYYPVVGISKQQAETYLSWRTQVIQYRMNKMGSKSKAIYRLPSEKEWEKAASGGLDIDQFPFGIEDIHVEIKVNPRATRYLKRLNNLNQSEEQLKKDIKTYNQSRKKITPFFVKQNNLPYFLKFDTPYYIYSPVNNKFALINMIGNVAEMVHEEGITKGGSYHHDLSESKIKNRIHISEPSPFVGFRAVAEILKN